MSTTTIVRRLDERGKVCPDPTFDTRMALNEMAPGEVMAELGYPCELIDGDRPVFRFIIQKV
jgi:hypothetical protein